MVAHIRGIRYVLRQGILQQGTYYERVHITAGYVLRQDVLWQGILRQAIPAQSPKCTTNKRNDQLMRTTQKHNKRMTLTRNHKDTNYPLSDFYSLDYHII